MSCKPGLPRLGTAPRGEVKLQLPPARYQKGVCTSGRLAWHPSRHIQGLQTSAVRVPSLVRTRKEQIYVRWQKKSQRLGTAPRGEVKLQLPPARYQKGVCTSGRLAWHPSRHIQGLQTSARKGGKRTRQKQAKMFKII
jgi:hypothetical protein